MKYAHKLFVAALLGLLLTGCEGSLTFIGSSAPVAAEGDELFWVSHALSVPVFLVVAGLLIYNLVRFRSRSDDETLPRQSTPHETLIEVIYTVVPLVLVLIAFVLTIHYMNAMAAPERTDDSLEVRVLGKRWYWEYEYPDQQIVVAQELHVPIDTNVHLMLESPDVIHSFWVPALAGKLDAIPGQQNEMWFRAVEVGEYDGYCAEYCGVQHAKMRIKVIAHTPEDFRAWVERQQQPPAAPQTELQQQGYEIVTGGLCAGCHTVGATTDSGRLGPDLAHFSSLSVFAGASYELTEDNLRQWLAASGEMKPGNLMEAVQLDNNMIDPVVAYLLMSPAEGGAAETATPEPPATEATGADGSLTGQ